MLVGRKNLRSLSNLSSLLRQRLISTNRIWTVTSNGGMRSNNTNRSIQISNLPLQESRCPQSLPRNLTPLISGNDTSNNACRYDASLFQLLRPVPYGLSPHVLPNSFLVCYLHSLCSQIRSNLNSWQIHWENSRQSIY